MTLVLIVLTTPSVWAHAGVLLAAGAAAAAVLSLADRLRGP